ncbi:MAG: hypothetical protein AB8D52_10160 [Gammaproteobacteria bacterium]
MNSKSITLLLIVICTILGNLIYYNLNHQPEFDQLDTATILEQTTPEELTKTSKSKLADIDSFSEITQRPLFSVDRQEVQEEIVASPTPMQKPARDPNLKLMGIVLSDDGQIALIKTRKDPKVKRVKLDEKVENWTLAELNNNSVRLLSGNQEIVLEMNRKADPKKRMQLNNSMNIKQQTKKNNLPPGRSKSVPTKQKKLAPDSPALSDIDEFNEIDEDDNDINEPPDR